MTPADADARLSAAERGARSYGDATYSSATALADPAEVRAASDEVSAEALAQEFLNLAEEMPAQDVDAATIGDALDMVLAEEEVVEAARAVDRAERQVSDAREQMDAAEAMAVSEPCGGCHDAKASAIAAAEADLADAQRALARARDRLREALATAADLAASMREGVRRRHGGIQSAVDDASVRMAETGFYQPWGN